MNIRQAASALMCVLVALLILISASSAQEIQFELQLLQMKPEIADFLEKRLLDGGDPALEVGAKLPKLLENGTIKSIEKHAFGARGGDRAKSRSSAKDLAQPGGEEIPEGFDIEVEPNVHSDGAVHLNYALTHAVMGREKVPRVIRIRSNTTLARQQLNFLQRFHSDGDELVLVAKVSNPATAPASDPSGSRFRFVHAQVTLFKVANVKARDALLKGAKASPDRIAAALEKSATLVDSIGTTTTAGQRQRIQHYDVRVERRENMLYEDGLHIDFEPIAGADGKRIDVRVELNHYSRTGERAKNADGGRADERLRIHTKAALEVDSGQLTLFPCERQLLPAEGASEPAAYILAVRASAHGGSETPSKMLPTIPANTDPKAIVTQMYSVPPSFFRKLQEKHPPQAKAGFVTRFTARKSLAAAGIDFPKGTSATFVTSNSQILLRHQPSAHKKLEKFIKEHR